MYRQTVKDQGEDVHDTHFDSALQGQPPSKPGTHLGIYFSLHFQPISLQLEAGLEPHTKDADGSDAPVERPWLENATPPGN